MPHVQIRIDGHGRGQIVVDGHDISRAVRCVATTSEARTVPTVELEIPALDGIEQTYTTARTPLPEHVHDALVALGWTPPEKD